MPVPIIVYAGVALVGGGLLGGYKAGQQVGQGVKDLMPYTVGAIAVYALYQASKK